MVCQHLDRAPPGPAFFRNELNSTPRQMTAPRLLACLLFPIAIAAQTAAPAPTPTALPAGAPHIVVETVGPEGWRLRLGPTNLGSLLESQRGRELWQPMTLPVFGTWQQLLGDEGAFEASKQRWLGYGGSVRLSLWYAPRDGSLQPARGVVVFAADGRTDMKLLAADVQQMQQSLGEWTTRDIGGEPLRVSERDGLLLTAPIPAGDHFVLALGEAEQLPAVLQHARGTVPAAGSKPAAPNTPALRWQVETSALIAMAAALDDGDAKTFAATGFGSLATLHGSVVGAGPHVQIEQAGTFPNGPRGLLAAFCPTTTGLSALQALVPADSNGAKVGRFDLRALYETFVEIVEKTGWAADDTDVRKDIRDELGIDPGADLLAHATDEIAFLGSPFQEVERPQDITWALLVKLRDAAKFDAALKTLLTHAKPNLSHSETVKVGDVELHRYGNLLQYDLWLAVGHGVFFLGGGRDAEANLTALVQQAAKLPADAKGTLPASHTELQRYLPPGLSGIAHGDFDALLKLPAEWLPMLLGEVLPFGRGNGEADPEQAEALRALLKEHHLNAVRTATGYADATWRWRLFW